MALQTNGFVNRRQRDRKFSKHGSEFGASNPEEYERMADGFLGGPAPTGVLEGYRPEGDVLRYDPNTGMFGILDRGRTIRSFYKPVPCSSIHDPILRRIAIDSGMCHGHPDNLSYFQSECARTYGN